MAEFTASAADAPMVQGTSKAPPRLARPQLQRPPEQPIQPKTPQRSRLTKTTEDVSSFVSPSKRGKDFDWGKTAVKNDPRHETVRQMLAEQHNGKATALQVKKPPEDTRVAEPYSPPAEKERTASARVAKPTAIAKPSAVVTTALETSTTTRSRAMPESASEGASSASSGVALSPSPACAADDLANTPYMRLHPSDPELAAIRGGIFQASTAHTEKLANLRTEMDSRFSLTHKAIDRVENRAYAGIAAAMAMPNLTPREPGKVIVAAGGASYLGRSAFAAGATYRSRCGAWLVHAAVAVTSRGDPAFRAHVGYEF